jgi:hypothetical protein
MKNKATVIILILTAIGLSVFAYKQFKKNKSFLKMTEAEKKKFVLDESVIRKEIKNNPNLTQQEKNEAEEKLNRENLKNFTQEEQKAMADYNIKNLMSGNTQLAVGSVDASMGLNSLGSFKL